MGQQDRPWADTATWHCQSPGRATSFLVEPSREQGIKSAASLESLKPPDAHIQPVCPLTDLPQPTKRKRAAMLLLWELPKNICWRHQKGPSENTGCQSKAVFCFSSGFLWERKLIFVQGFWKQKYEIMAVLKQTLQVMSWGRKRTAPALVFIDLCQKLSGVYFRSFQAWISRSLLSSMCHTGYWGCGNYPRGINSWHWGCKTLRAPVHSNSFGRAALICRHQTSRSVVRINPLKTQTGLLCQWSKKWNVWGSISYAYTHIFRNQHIPSSISAILFFFNTRYHTVLPVFYWGINIISHTEIHGNHKVKYSKMPKSSSEL